MAKKPPKNLTPEDRHLWKKVTDTVKPSPQKAKHGDALSDEELFLSAMGEKAPMKGTMRGSHKIPTPQRPTKAKPPVKNQKSNTLPPISSMDRKAKSRLARGLRAIDGRIDLHGMTQNQAHEALQTYIVRAQASGWKTILVITGKGAQRTDHERSIYLDMGRESPGVLRRKVPQWLSEPEMRKFIIGYEESAPNHGGSGALYVQIRREKTTIKQIMD